MTESGPAELRAEVARLAADSFATRTILLHVLARLAAIGNADIAAAIRLGFEDAENTLKAGAMSPGGLARALGAVEAMKKAAPGAGGGNQEIGAFHAESNDSWPEDDY